jgi:hypothetical protein
MRPDATRLPHFLPMKLRSLLLAVLAFLAGASGLHAQTLDWGNDVFGDVVDSNGAALDPTFIFELGAFDAGFTPDSTNVANWVGHWNVFDRAQFNAALGYFASSVNMLPNGSSDSLYVSPDLGSFEGLNAYLFVRNNDLTGPETEWLLVRATDWIFPVADDCCPGALSAEWSLSDVDDETETPLYGSVDGITGPGVVDVPGVHDLQTHTFVPEPATALLAFLGLLATAVRRRRI